MKELTDLLTALKTSTFDLPGRDITPEFRETITHGFYTNYLDRIAEIAATTEINVDVKNEDNLTDDHAYPKYKLEARTYTAPRFEIRSTSKISSTNYYWKGEPEGVTDRATQQEITVRDNSGNTIEHCVISNGHVTAWERFCYQDSHLAKYVSIKRVSFIENWTEIVQADLVNSKVVESRKLSTFNDRIRHSAGFGGRDFPEKGETKIALVRESSLPGTYVCVYYDTHFRGLDSAINYLRTDPKLQDIDARIAHIGLGTTTPTEKTGYTLSECQGQMIAVWNRVRDFTLDGEQLYHKEDDALQKDAEGRILNWKKFRFWSPAWITPVLCEGRCFEHQAKAQFGDVYVARTGPNTIETIFPDNVTAQFPLDIDVKEFQKDLATRILYTNRGGKQK